MQVNVNVKDNLRIRAFYMFFVITSIQVGVGITGAPMYLFKEAQQDSWISIIVAQLFIIMVLFTMFRTLNKYENADIFGIQVDVFGKWIGKLLGTVYIIHFAAELLSVIINYIEIVQVFIFPESSSFVLSLLLLSLVVYSVLGGIRIIIGVIFIFFFLSHWVLFLLIEPALRMDFTHFQPVFNTPVADILNGSKATAYTFLGFEILFLLYPFIQNKKQSKFPVYFGTCWSTGLLMIVTVFSIGYFSHRQLLKLEWSALSLYKIVSFPFIERFDYIVVAEWMMVVLPNMIVLMWAITYGMKRLYKIPQKITLYAAAFLTLFLSSIISYHHVIVGFTNMVAKVGFWIVYVYPFILFLLVIIKRKLAKNYSKGSDQQ